MTVGRLCWCTCIVIVDRVSMFIVCYLSVLLLYSIVHSILCTIHIRMTAVRSVAMYTRSQHLNGRTLSVARCCCDVVTLVSVWCRGKNDPDVASQHNKANCSAAFMLSCCLLLLLALRGCDIALWHRLSTLR